MLKKTLLRTVSDPNMIDIGRAVCYTNKTDYFGVLWAKRGLHFKDFQKTFRVFIGPVYNMLFANLVEINGVLSSPMLHKGH